MSADLRVLAVATKAPYPPIGGGNVTLHGLLVGLQRAGVKVRVVAVGTTGEGGASPYPIRVTGTPPHRWPRAALAVASGAPATLARYRVRPLAQLVEAELADFAPHVVHLEQLHVGWLLRLLVGRVATVLRQQNVESRLLERLAEMSGPPLRWLLRAEARRMARVEAAACDLADVVAAISEVDAVALRNLAPRSRVRILPAAWPAELGGAPNGLAGNPVFVCLGSFDWRPNRDGARWLLQEVWPIVRESAPGAILHLAGPGSESLVEPSCGGVVRHGGVPRAAALYPPEGVVLIPLRAGSGVRLRLLEAWSAGVPAVTTPVGGEGLVVVDGDGAILATAAPAFADAALRLARDGELRRELADCGRRHLARHDADRVAAAALELYREALMVRRPETTRSPSAAPEPGGTIGA